MRTRIKIISIAFCLALVAASCGDSGDSPESAPEQAPAPIDAPETQAPAPEPATETAAPAPSSDLPSVEMVDVATGTTVNLASFAPAEQPLVLWFWAPH